jgi:hypothetical protein
VFDDARLRDSGCDIADAAYDRIGTHILAQDIILLHAILKRDDRGTPLRDWLEACRNRFCIPELHTDQHEVSSLDLTDCFRGLDLSDVQIPAWACDLQPVAAERSEVRAAGDERHIATRSREPAAKISPNST